MSFGKRYDGPGTEAKRGIGQLRAVVKVQRDRIIASYVPSAPRRRVPPVARTTTFRLLERRELRRAAARVANA